MRNYRSVCFSRGLLVTGRARRNVGLVARNEVLGVDVFG